MTRTLSIAIKENTYQHLKQKIGYGKISSFVNRAVEKELKELFRELDQVVVELKSEKPESNSAIPNVSTLISKINQLCNPLYHLKKHAGKVALAFGATNLTSYQYGKHTTNSDLSPNLPINQVNQIIFTNATHS